MGKEDERRLCCCCCSRITKADFKLTQNRQKANRLGATTDSESSKRQAAAVAATHGGCLAGLAWSWTRWPVEICVTEPSYRKTPGERKSEREREREKGQYKCRRKASQGACLKDTLVGITKPHKRLACCCRCNVGHDDDDDVVIVVVAATAELPLLQRTLSKCQRQLLHFTFACNSPMG